MDPISRSQTSARISAPDFQVVYARQIVFPCFIVSSTSPGAECLNSFPVKNTNWNVPLNLATRRFVIVIRRRRGSSCSLAETIFRQKISFSSPKYAHAIYTRQGEREREKMSSVPAGGQTKTDSAYTAAATVERYRVILLGWAGL